MFGNQLYRYVLRFYTHQISFKGDSDCIYLFGFTFRWYRECYAQYSNTIEKTSC
jgi:hypothetical protein